MARRSLEVNERGVQMIFKNAMVLEISDAVVDSINKMSVNLEMSSSQVILQSLRVYEMISEGHAELVIKNKPKGCPSDEGFSK